MSAPQFLLTHDVDCPRWLRVPLALLISAFFGAVVWGAVIGLQVANYGHPGPTSPIAVVLGSALFGALFVYQGFAPLIIDWWHRH